METKVCTRCENEQSIENFYIRRTRNNQRKSICKECESKQKARKVKHIPDLEGEVWTDWVGLEGIYLASNKGRFRRIMHRKNPTNRLVKPFIHDDGEGHIQVSTHHLGKPVHHLAHRVVAIAFIPNPLNLPEVNHKDGNKSNNCVENLEWVTSLENVRESWRMGLSKPQKGEAHGNSTLTDADVIEIRRIGKDMKARELGAIYGVNEQAIYKILSGIRWKHLLPEVKEQNSEIRPMNRIKKDQQ